MAFRPESRWWIVTLGIVAVLLAISALALDHPNVVWRGEKAACPACRSEVPYYATKCAHCAMRFDWVPPALEDSPRCAHGISEHAAAALNAAIQTEGEDAVRGRVSKALDISMAQAGVYLASVGRGRCGWCGGSGRELVPGLSDEDRTPCTICGGSGTCMGCDGERRVQIGSQAADRALMAYRRHLEDLPPAAPGGAPAGASRFEAMTKLQREVTETLAGTREMGEVLGAARPAFAGTAFAALAGEVPALQRAQWRIARVMEALVAPR